MKNEKGRLSAAMGYKKLEKLLSRSPMSDFLVAIWHVDRMQADKPNASRFFNRLPNEAVTKDFTSNYYIHKWLLESLLTAYFGSSPAKQKVNQRYRVLQLDQWEAICQLVNLVHSIEDSESANTLHQTNVFLEVYRIMQRQFPWQRGFATRQMLYRSLRLYRTPETIERFQADTGIALDDFVKLGFMYWAKFRNSYCVKTNFSFEKFGINSTTRDRFLRHISDHPRTFAQHAKQFRYRNCRMAHRPSHLRTHPIVNVENDFGKFIVAPLIDLIFLRVTQGLFFDFVKYDDLREVIADQFVAYTIELFDSGKCTFNVHEEVTYKKKKNNVQSPDLFLVREGSVSAAIECKARRMSHQAQFGEDPTEQANSGFREIAQGMTQLWRYLADADAGLLPDSVAPDANTRLVLLTYDSWMQESYNIKPAVNDMANKIADKKKIAAKFRRPVIFLTILDLEHIIERGDSKQILGAFDGQLMTKYRHWTVSSIFDDIHGELKENSIFTDDAILNVAPWFNIDQLSED